jgi:hypothetical protein
MTMDQIYDVLIIGGGPAGVAAAYLCHKYGMAYLLLESGKSIFQGIATTYPEGKNVYPSKPKEAPQPFLVEELRPPDKPVTVEKYIQYVQHFVQHENLYVQLETQFEDIAEVRDHLAVRTSKGTLKTKKVILAFGSSIPKELSVYGDAKMVAKTVDDPKKYVGVRTLVIGGRNRDLQLHEFPHEKRHRLHRFPGSGSHLRPDRCANHRLYRRGLPGGKRGGPVDPADRVFRIDPKRSLRDRWRHITFIHADQ